MNHEAYRHAVHGAAKTGDWENVEQLSRRLGWLLLGRALRRVRPWLLGRARALVARRRVRAE